MILVEPEASKGREAVARLVKTKGHLPAQVFEKEFEQYCWLDFEDAIDTSFFECLVAVSSAHSSRGFLVSCLDRLDPESAGNFGHEGIGRVAIDAGVDVLSHVLDTGLIDSVINIRNVGDVIAFVADNGQWAFVADRSAEVAVGAQMGTMGWPLVEGLRYQSFEAMLRIASMPYRGELPQRVRQLYEQNYKARSWVPWGSAHR